MVKKCIIVLLILTLWIVAAIPAAAVQPRLVDEAGLLTESQARELEQLLDEISQRQGVDVVVVTTNSVGNTAAEIAAGKIYNSYGYRNDGIILLIDMGRQEMGIRPRGGAVTMFTVAGQDYIADRVQDELHGGNYADACRLFATLCDDFVTQARTGEPYDADNLPEEPFDPLFWAVVSLIVGLVAALIITAIMAAKLKSVRFKHQAEDYIRPGSMRVTESRDIYLYRNVTRRPRPKSNSSGGNGRSASGGTSRRF